MQFANSEAIMRRAIQIATQGIGYVEPNPAVGAVIVDQDDNLVCEGFHRKYGGPHAEVDALDQAEKLPDGAVMFVTLEPCSHHGKTPPCCDAIIASGIKHVVVGMLDPSDHANGRGIERLRAAGIVVETGLMEDEIRRLNAPFITLTTQNRPYVHAKWAMTLDGKIATRTGSSQWISNEQSREVVHQLRSRMDAIIVGAGTTKADDPMLTARPAGARVATRVVIDSRAQLSPESQLVKSISEAPVLVATSTVAPRDNVERLEMAGVEVLPIESPAASGPDRPDLATLLTELGNRRFTNVLVEGGAELLGSFFDQELVDEVHVFVAPKFVGGRDALTAIAGAGLEAIPQLSQIEDQSIESLDGDIYICGAMKY